MNFKNLIFYIFSWENFSKMYKLKLSNGILLRELKDNIPKCI